MYLRGQLIGSLPGCLRDSATFCAFLGNRKPPSCKLPHDLASPKVSGCLGVFIQTQVVTNYIGGGGSDQRKRNLNLAKSLYQTWHLISKPQCCALLKGSQKINSRSSKNIPGTSESFFIFIHRKPLQRKTFSPHIIQKKTRIQKG